MSHIDDASLLLELSAARQRLLDAIHQVIVGQDEVIEQMLITLFSGGHALFIGVPGLAKTLLVSTTAQALDLDFRRIQFTPDLMPSDITGSEILEEDRSTGHRSFRFVRGPLFTQVLLADEINRTPPKTQAALLQAMQEREVTAGGQTHPLTPPFQVFATQNPIEQEGTYPLPEAQLDRFTLSIHVDYPQEAEELEIVRRTTLGQEVKVEPVLSVEDLLAMQALIRRMPQSEQVLRAAVRLARATRPGPDSPELTRKWVRWGAGPRASQFLVLAAQTRAALLGHEVASMEDLQAVAVGVLQHRVVLTFSAEAEGIRSADLIRELFQQVTR